MIGATLGHYRIVEKIGEGGMGEVYRARDERLDRDVAIKVLHEAVAQDADRLVRFEREAKAVAKLAHPNILEIWDFGSEDGVAYAVMELLEGESLREMVSKGGITAGKAVEYARAIADGLAAAHDKGIIHRDLKPENVFLTTDGRIKILDFGLAKLKLPEADLTTETPTATLDTDPGGLIGTVPYMAPEQVQGQPADHRSDIFALGVVLYEMLTGHRPFNGTTTVETAAAILKEDPEPISAAAPAVSPALGSVVSKCLEKRPEDRFSAAHDLALTLGAVDSATWSPPTQDQSLIGKRWPHMLAVVFAAAIALFFVFPPEGLFDRLAEQPAEAPLPRIVVLPFENLGPPEDEYFADGMTEEIISRLSAVSGLLVISRTSAMQYKGTNKAIHEIGDELNVQYALEGTVRWERAGEGYGRVRITPQLIKVADDTHLWSDRYDRAIESVFEVQSDIAGQVVEQLHVSLLKPEEDVLNARLTDSPEAYEAYLRGLHHSVDYDNLDSVRLAVAMFERSVELDPDFAVAWANLSVQMSWLNFNWERTPERREAARHAAKTAIEIEPFLPEGHWAQGIYFYYCHRDYERALEALGRALAIRPNYTSALFYEAVFFRRQGHWQEAIELLQRAFLLDPKDAEIAEALSRTYQATRNFLQADRFIDLSISLAPDRATGYLMKGWNLSERGRPEEARQTLKSSPVRVPLQEWYFIEIDLADRRFEAALKRTLEFDADAYVEVLGELGEAGHVLDQCRCYHFLGDLQGVRTTCGLALDLLKKLVRQDPQIYPRYSAGFGEAYAYLGLKDEAIREAQRGVALLPVSRDALLGPVRVEHLALVYALVNEPDLAIDQLDYLLSIPGNLSVGALRNHPNWDPLRDHPRFQALLEKYDTN